MPLIEFEGEIVGVSDAGVVIKRDDGNGLQEGMTFNTTVPEEQACGRRLYTRVRVTVEAVEDEPDEPAGETTP